MSRRSLVPAIGDPRPPDEDVGLPRGAGDYISCLFRDWGWANGRDEENDRSLAAIRRITRGQELGRMLVLGAGGCRLAYDLHVQCGATETAVVDIDPFLLVIAEAVIRGAAVSLTETSVNAPEVDPVSRAWALSAPSGPLGAEVFHFFLADGTEPPFAEQTFDTVVTPWFIDQVPTDLEAMLRRVHGLLVPGGRWINHGPLIYRPDALPIARWYARQEIFELAGAVGFRMGAWESAPQPHLVSPLTGRGLIENVLTFEAREARASEPVPPVQPMPVSVAVTLPASRPKSVAVEPMIWRDRQQRLAEVVAGEVVVLRRPVTCRPPCPRAAPATPSSCGSCPTPYPR